jgi:hypothetical protein
VPLDRESISNLLQAGLSMPGTHAGYSLNLRDIAGLDVALIQ